jgi:hypothetical protein
MRYALIADLQNTGMSRLLIRLVEVCLTKDRTPVHAFALSLSVKLNRAISGFWQLNLSGIGILENSADQYQDLGEMLKER